MKIEKSTFVISGASSGLGAATARLLSATGGNVVLADMNQQAGEALQAELGANALFVQTDVTNEESAKGAIQRNVKQIRRAAWIGELCWHSPW